MTLLGASGLMEKESDPNAEFQALQTIISAAQSFEPATRRRIFDAAATFLQIEKEDTDE